MEIVVPPQPQKKRLTSGNYSSTEHTTNLNFITSALVISVHSLLWFLTVLKRNVGSRGGVRIPIIHLVIRDGAWAFIGMCCEWYSYVSSCSQFEFLQAAFTAMVLHSYVINVEAHILFPYAIVFPFCSPSLADVDYSWPTTLASILVCYFSFSVNFI